ncbi:MAG: hypothetical protein GY797_04935, partial [Deltaproteobacteria bacterium]|nr:hypothetical protein [Deltaproteobacteria bacterium]
MKKILFSQQELADMLATVLSLHGWKRLVALPFYPLITLVTTPLRLGRTLWNCRVLADGKNWGTYPHFSPLPAINSLFYWSRALNLSCFGRAGTVPYLGLGGYRLTRCFHYSLISLYAYWKAGAVAVLTGMFGWWGSHFLWLGHDGILLWKILIIVLILFSTTFYANTFARQNYNVLGWLFMPIGLYGWATGHWTLAALAWLGASFGSFTVVFQVCLLSLGWAVQVWSIVPMFTVIPAVLKLITHFWPFWAEGAILQSFLEVSKAIGLTKHNTKYVRKSSIRGIKLVYYSLIYGQFIATFWIINDSPPILVITACIIFFLNLYIARFADQQSMLMLVVSVTAATMMQTTAHPYLLLSFWLLVSPLPLIIGFLDYGFHVLFCVPIFQPFTIEPILQDMENFLAPVSKGERVLMAFDDPRNTYEKIFDGYRVILEVPLYVAACKEIHFLPDWWGVFELNYEGAPDFWGRDVEDVERQMEYWKADYVVVYQDAGTELAKKWSEAGFRVLSHLSWAKYEKAFNVSRPYKGPTPDWWL